MCVCVCDSVNVSGAVMYTVSWGLILKSCLWWEDFELLLCPELFFFLPLCL